MSTSESAPIVVIGATGQQGSSAVEALLERGLPVRALTRNVDSAAAQELARRGVELATADLDDPVSIEQGLRGAAAAFAMTTFAGPGGPEGEVRQGKNIGDAAAAANLPFLVYSSVGGAERRTGIPHFDGKGRIEEYLTGLVPLNIVRPTFFMENLTYMIQSDGPQVRVAVPLPADVPLQMVAVRDIGRTAAALLAAADPSAEPVEIAGDELTGEQIAQRVGEHMGAPASFVQAPLEMFGDDEDTKIMFRWLTEPPAYRADFDRTRVLVPDVENLATWLRRN